MGFDLMIKAFMVACAIAIGVASTMYLKMKDDNPIEQAAETFITSSTGQVLDLTPTTK